MKKLNNKGFSLVELIVVIAIMAILAVTLAPRLVQYVERSRQASDQEAVGTIFTAVKLAHLDDANGFEDVAEAPVDPETAYTLKLRGTGTTLYTVTDDTDWALNETYEDGNEYFETLVEILGSFELKSSNVGANTDIIITRDEGKYSVLLDYNGDGFTDGMDYELSE